MPRRLPLTVQTMYADLVERCTLDRLKADFAPTGNFFTKESGGRLYWYFREAADLQGNRRSRYVGPDSPELRQHIEAHRQDKEGYKARRSLVRSLAQTGIIGPDAITGKVLEALAAAGVFRLRAVVIGTMAYQTYGGILGVVLGEQNQRTEDLDIAQFKTISVAVDDHIQLPFGDILKEVDPRFEPVIGQTDARHATRYVIPRSEVRVDILTPNRGPDDETPVFLPAIQAEGQPLRFLDFLIYQEVKAVALFGGGVAINVPAPERYALHKLIVSRRRLKTGDSQAKAGKDLRQAGELLDVLIEQRPYELTDLWEELTQRGPKWEKAATEGLSLLDWAMADSDAPDVRHRFSRLVGIEDDRPAPR